MVFWYSYAKFFSSLSIGFMCWYGIITIMEEMKMGNFEPIQEKYLKNLGSRERGLYEASIGTVGVRAYLEQCGAFLEGHFVYTGGGHGNVYINIRDLDTTDLLKPLAMQMAYEISEPVDAIIGTPHGADTLAVLVAGYYSDFTGQAVKVLKLLKDGDGYVWYKDHGEKAHGRRVVQIEDIINSAKSLRETREFLLASQVNVQGFVTVCNRRSDKNPGLAGLQSEFDVEIAKALLEVDAVNYGVDLSHDPTEQCPLCADGVTIDTRVGHGKKFLAEIEGQYPELYKKVS